MCRPEIANERAHFWSRVAKKGPDDCWLFIGCGKRRYGSSKANGKFEQSQRCAWIFTHGPIPDGLKVLHRCDVPRCCNPDHLFLGTQADNVRDCIAKGRWGVKGAQPGEAHPCARLDEKAVASIRKSYAAGGVFMRQLAKRHGISIQQVSKIIKGQRWKVAA